MSKIDCRVSKTTPVGFLNKIYTILVIHCGALEDERFSFCCAYNSDYHCSEYRFQGDLGFGGKFWNNQDQWYVNCYRETETPEILEMIEKANMALEVVRKDYLKYLESQA